MQRCCGEMDVSVLSRVDSLSPLLFSRVQSGVDQQREEQLDEALGRRRLHNNVGPDQPVPAPDPSRNADKHRALDRRRSYSTVTECAIRNFAKGALLGVGGRTAAVILPQLLRGSSHHPLRRGFWSVEHAQWAAFLGSFLALHNTALQCRYLTYVPSHAVIDHYSQLLAGTLAGFSLRLAPAYARPYLALLFSVRACEVLGRSAAEKGLLPRFLWEQADVKLMMLSSSVVMTCWIFEPQLLEPAYLHFLNKQSGKDARLLRGIAAAFDGDLDSRHGVLSALNALRSELSLPPLHLHPECGTLHCNVLHLPVQSCSAHALTYFATGWLRAVRLYAPVHLLPLLLLRSSALVRKPLGTTSQAAINIGRSALFLSSYCTTGFAILCTCARLAQSAGTPPKRWHASALSSLCGLALLFEKPGRRLELALYTTLQAARCWPYPAAKDKMRKHLSVPAFAFAAGVVSHHFARHPSTVRQSYRSILGRFLDTTGGDNHRRLLS